MPVAAFLAAFSTGLIAYPIAPAGRLRGISALALPPPSAPLRPLLDDRCAERYRHRD